MILANSRVADATKPWYIAVFSESSLKIVRKTLGYYRLRRLCCVISVWALDLLLAFAVGARLLPCMLKRNDALLHKGSFDPS
jgi:hypothetical protein